VLENKKKKRSNKRKEKEKEENKRKEAHCWPTLKSLACGNV
jgi:hypothetical protein